jgi:hypothetical protein
MRVPELMREMITVEQTNMAPVTMPVRSKRWDRVFEFHSGHEFLTASFCVWVFPCRHKLQRKSHLSRRSCQISIKYYES